jgi:O-glycosyl hydrolase
MTRLTFASVIGPLAIAVYVVPSSIAVADVVIDGAIRHQTMDGFGSSVRVFDDPHVFENFNPATGRAATVLTTEQQNQVLDKLYGDLKLTRVRPASPDTAVGAGIEPVNDNTNPGVTDLSKFNFSWKNLDAHVDYIVRARERGVTTSFLSPLSREAWMGTTTAADVAEYSEWLLAQVKRAADRGVRFPFLSISNEPSYTRNTMSGAFIRDVIKNLGPRLRAEGFQTTFVTPDDVRSSNAAAKAQVILSDPIAREYVGALATHLYDEPVSNVSQLKMLADQYQLPLWMTEFTMGAMGTTGRAETPIGWASLMHELISTYNVSAVDYLWGFFGEWEGNATTLISLNNTGSVYDGYTLNKTYYTTGQFSRFIEPGSTRVEALSSDASIQTTAYVSNSELVLVAINTGHVGQEVTFDITGLPDLQEFQGFRTSSAENWAIISPLPATNSSFTATLPGNSVTTFIASIPDRLPGDYNANGIVDAADYVVWRHTLGSTVDLLADGNQNSQIDTGDYDFWRARFGKMAASGVSINSIEPADNVPEPKSMLLAVLAATSLAWRFVRNSGSP